MEEPTVDYDRGFIDGAEEGKRQLRAENEKEIKWLRTELDTANNKITDLLCSVVALQAELDEFQTENTQLKAELTERKKRLEVAFEILEEYTPTEKLQEAVEKMVEKMVEKKGFIKAEASKKRKRCE